MLDKAKELIRAWFAKVWNFRGGGLYAVGWAATFVYLEVTTVLGEILEAEGIVEFFTSQLAEFFFRFISDSIANMIQAFMWPVVIVQWNTPVGAILLGLAFAVFPTYIKPHITAWLFPDGEPESESQS